MNRHERLREIDAEGAVIMVQTMLLPEVVVTATGEIRDVGLSHNLYHNPRCLELIRERESVLQEMELFGEEGRDADHLA